MNDHPPDTVIAAYRSLQQLSKRELLGQYRTAIGAITPKAAYRHMLIGGLMTHRFGPGAAEIIRNHR